MLTKSSVKNFSIAILLILITINIIVLGFGGDKYGLIVRHNCEIKPYAKIPQPLVKSSKSEKAYYIVENIPQPKFLQESHSATLEVLPKHNLIALWFAGSHEAKPDVRIWQSIYNDGNWQMARPILSHEQLSFGMHKAIYKLGNPVVYLASSNQLNLFVVTVGVIGGWSGSQISQFVSNNYGTSWNVSGVLPLSPLFNISNLVRTSPISLSDGGFYLPAYFEMKSTYPILLRFNPQGNFTKQQRLTDAQFMAQPSVVAVNSNILYTYMRNMRGKGDWRLYLEVSKDAGVHWSRLIPTNLYNHNSSLAAINLGRNQGFIMVHNLGDDRSKLVLAYSKDGLIWRNFYYLEKNNGYSHEFSYPSIKIDGDTVNIVYTWERKAIRYVRFNQLWLDQKLSKAESIF